LVSDIPAGKGNTIDFFNSDMLFTLYSMDGTEQTELGREIKGGGYEKYWSLFVLGLIEDRESAL
jgi:hypothetical protein